MLTFQVGSLNASLVRVLGVSLYSLNNMPSSDRGEEILIILESRTIISFPSSSNLPVFLTKSAVEGPRAE